MSLELVQKTVVPAVELDELEAMLLVEQWECLPGYPRTDPGIRALAKTIMELCGADHERAVWITEKIRRGAERCPAPIELRRVYTQTYPPADGLQDHKVDLGDHIGFGGKRRSE